MIVKKNKSHYILTGPGNNVTSPDGPGAPRPTAGGDDDGVDYVIDDNDDTNDQTERGG